MSKNKDNEEKQIPSPIGRPRKFKSPKQMWEKWAEYKEYCDHRVITKTQFCNKTGRFVTAEIPASTTYTLTGFCIFCGIALQKITETYDPDPRYREVLTRIRSEIEQDAREKFEFGIIPEKLAALWMSKHGYSTKEQQEVRESVKIVDDIPPEPTK